MSDKKPGPCSPARLNPYRKETPSYLKHLVTAAGMLVAGAMAWQAMESQVGANADTIKKNQKAIGELTDSVNEINRRQGVIINNQENVREQLQRERAVQAERYERTEKRLDRIIDTLNRRTQPGVRPR